MHLCQLPNQTYAVLNLKNDKILSIQGNEIVGAVGRILDSLLVKKQRRRCNLIGEDSLGEEGENGTFNGNLGLIQSGRANIYLKSEAPIMNLPFINYGIPFYLEKFLIGHDISNATNNKKTNDVLSNLDFGPVVTASFVAMIFISLLMACFLEILIDLVIRRRRLRQIKKHLLTRLFERHWSDHSKLSSLGIFLSFYFLYLWFVRLMIANSIKTNKVVINTDNLIKTAEDALQTERIFCVLEGNTELNIALSSNKEHILNRLWRKKSLLTRPLENLHNEIKRDRCVIEKETANMNLGLDNLFTVVSENTGYAVASVMADARQNQIFWLNSNPIFEMNFHVIIRNEKAFVDHFNKILVSYTENGMPLRMIESIRNRAFEAFVKNKVYRTVEEYLNDNTKFDELSLDSLSQLFCIFFTFCTIILLVCLVDHCIYRNAKARLWCSK